MEIAIQLVMNVAFLFVASVIAGFGFGIGIYSASKLLQKISG